MNNRLITRSSFLAVPAAGALALALLGCGGDSMGGGGGGPDGGAGGPDSGPVAPTVTITPADGAKGVRKTDSIVLTFSQQMDEPSVEAAWSSTSLPKSSMNFSWNGDATVLTVDASAVLDYPKGDNTVDPYTYEIDLDATAAAWDGTTLEAAVTSSFDTAREVTMPIGRLAAATGSYDGGAMGSDIRVGDTPSNGTWRGFITADLSALPPVVAIIDAQLGARQTDVVGTPYTDLGDIELVQISPATSLDATAYTGAVRSDIGVFSNSTSVGNPDGDRSLDITDELSADLADGASVSTYRLDFATAQDLGNDDDHVIFDPTSVAFSVHLLAE